MTFHVGMEVECFDASGAFLLTQGAHYTITSIHDFYVGVSGVLSGKPEWFQNRFRPVAKIKTDISIFTRMLNPSKVDA